MARADRSRLRRASGRQDGQVPPKGGHGPPEADTVLRCEGSVAMVADAGERWEGQVAGGLGGVEVSGSLGSFPSFQVRAGCVILTREVRPWPTSTEILR